MNDFDTQADTTERERQPKRGTPPMNPPRNTARRTPRDTGENGADTSARFAVRDGIDRRTRFEQDRKNDAP